MRIGLGLMAPMRGALFVTRRGLWAPIVWPTLLSTAAAAGLGWLVVRWMGERWGALIPGGGIVAGVVGAVAFVLLAALAFLVVQPLVAAPFTDHLTERVESSVRAHVPRTSVLRSAAQGVAHGALKSACYLLALGLPAALGLISGVGSVLGVALLVVFCAYDGFDYPLARRGVSFGGKWAFLARHPGLAMGYGSSALVMQLIPLAFLVAPATNAVGATLVYLDLPETRRDDASGSLPVPGPKPAVDARRSA